MLKLKVIAWFSISKNIFFIRDKDMWQNYLTDQVMNFYRIIFQCVNKDFIKFLKNMNKIKLLKKYFLMKFQKAWSSSLSLASTSTKAKDKETAKIRVLFDTSCASDRPSLSDYLYSGPNLLSKNVNTLLRFRFNFIAIVADIKQAFLNV